MRACTLAALLLAAAAASAEEDPGSGTLTIAEVRQVEAISDDRWGKAYALLGPVRLEVGGVFRLRALRCVIWLDPKANATLFDLMEGMGAKERRVPLWAIRAIYAEGGRAPALFHIDGRVFRCATLFFDLQRHTGLLVDAELRLRRVEEGVGELPEIVVRAGRFRARGPGRWTASDVRLYTTDYVDPEIAIHVDRLEMKNDKVAQVLGALSRLSAKARAAGVGVPQSDIDQALAEFGDAALGTDLDFYGVAPHVLGLRILRWPHINANQRSALKLRLEAEAGDRGRLGNGGWLGVGLRTMPFTFLLGGGYYGGRGPLVDLDVVFDGTGDLSGRSRSAYLRDQDETQPATHRYWTSNLYRWTLSDTLRLDGELALLSDADWLLTYDEREFKEGKEQESLLYLRHRGAAGYAGLVGKFRTIRFLEVVEELPRLSASLPVWTLFRVGEAVVQVAGNVELGSLHLRRAHDDPRPDLSSARFDVDPTIYAAFSLGPVRVVPFSTVRFTAYEQTVDGGSLARFAASAGVRADVQLWRWYGDRKHTVNVSLEYVDLFEVGESASRLFPFDAVDMLTPYEALVVRIRNRWQRRSANGLQNYLTFEIHGAWFPQRRQPLGRMGDGYLDLSLAWWRGDEIGFGVRTDIDPELGELSAAAIEGWWRPTRELLLGAGVRHLQDDSDIVTLTVETTVDTRWRIVLFSQFDARDSVSLDQGLLIERIGQTAVFSVRFTYDPGDGDFGVTFSIDLLEAFRRDAARRGREREIRLSEFSAR